MQPKNAAPKKNPRTSIFRPCRSDDSRHADGGEDEGHRAEAQVEPEDRPPARESDQRATDDRPERQGQARDGGPDPERIGAGCTIGVHVPDDRQRPGLARRGADAHDDATGDEPVHVARQRGHDGSAAEDGDAGEHDPLSTEDVTEHPRRQHEAGEGQCVPVDDPLQRRDAGVQVALDVGQPDADDGVVEEGEEEDRRTRWPGPVPARPNRGHLS